jgi:hypothetical protein
MEPRRMLSSIKVIFIDGFLNDTFATKMNMNSTVIFLDSYHLLNCIWPDSLGERAYNLAKKNLEVMVFCHDKKGYEDAFKEIKKDLQHMPEKLSCIEKRYKTLVHLPNLNFCPFEDPCVRKGQLMLSKTMQAWIHIYLSLVVH